MDGCALWMKRELLYTSEVVAYAFYQIYNVNTMLSLLYMGKFFLNYVMKNKAYKSSYYIIHKRTLHVAW